MYICIYIYIQYVYIYIYVYHEPLTFPNTFIYIHVKIYIACICIYIYIYVPSSNASGGVSPIASGRGWLQLVGSLKLWVSFTEYSLFYRALLQKRPIILRSLLIVATP